MAKKFATSAKAKNRIAKISFDGRQLIFEESVLENQISLFSETHFPRNDTNEEQVGKIPY